MIEFDTYEGYDSPVIQEVNKNASIATYKDLNGNKDIICIYNNISNTNILLYTNTFNNIYNLLNKRKKIKNKRKKVRKLFDDHAKRIS